MFESPEGYVSFVSPTGQIGVVDVAPPDWFDPMTERYYHGETTFTDVDGVQVRVTQPGPDEGRVADAPRYLVAQTAGRGARGEIPVRIDRGHVDRPVRAGDLHLLVDVQPVVRILRSHSLRLTDRRQTLLAEGLQGVQSPPAPQTRQYAQLLDAALTIDELQQPGLLPGRRLGRRRRPS